MKRKRSRQLTTTKAKILAPDYDHILSGMIDLLERSRRAAARSVNTVMTATYWEIGRQIIEFEQGGKRRAEYGKQLLERLAEDLTKQFGRGFGVDNLQRMRSFYQLWSPERIYATLSRESSKIVQTVSGKFDLAEIAKRFPLF